MAFSLPKSLFARMTASTPAVVTDDVSEGSFSHVLNRDMYKQRDKIVDDESLKDREPFPLLSGESIEYIGCSYEDHVIAISNYRLFATEPNGFYSVPLGLVELLEMLASKDSFNIMCKDGRVFRLSFFSITKCRAWFDRVQECKKRSHRDTKSLFAFVYRAYRKDEKLSRQLSGSEADGVTLTNVPETNGGGGLLSLSSDPLHWREEVMTSEYRRMGLCPGPNGTENRVWRISQCNDKYEVCPTYPKLLLVPGLVTDEELVTAAKFRMSGRLPVVSWRHQTNGCVIVRSSQPLVGVLGWRNPTDEKLLLEFSHSCSLSTANSQSTEKMLQNGGTTCANGVRGSASLVRDNSEEFFSDSDEEGLSPFDPEDETADFPKLKVFDLRSYTAALGNRAKGGGCECTDYYPNCEIFYKGLPNIHTVRKSFHQMKGILSSEDQTNYLSSLEGTQWLSYLCQLLSVACEVVGVVNNEPTPSPILVHCSDGWDRTTQIITLAELMLDPYYRTIKGFRVLVEREWVGFGHRFSDRCGHVTEDTNSRSPIFLQWLDCVYQLLRQCPCDFQFNETFLVKLGLHSFSCLYGTFLCNNMKEREEERVSEDTYPVWSLLHEGNTEIINYLYQRDSSRRVLSPVTNIKYMMLWKEMYLNPLLTPYHIEHECTVSQTRPRPIEKSDLSHSSSFGTPCSDSTLPTTSPESNYQSIPSSLTTLKDVRSVESETKPESLELKPAASFELKREMESSESEREPEFEKSELVESESKPESMEPRQEAESVESIQELQQASPEHEGTSDEHRAEHSDTHSSSSSTHLASDQTSNHQVNGVLTPDKSIHRECGESHENLHGTLLKALRNDSNNDLVVPMTSASEAMAIGNGHIAVSSQGNGSITLNTGADHEGRHSPAQTRFKIQFESDDSSPGSSSSLLRQVTENGLSSSTPPNKQCNGGSSPEATREVSPHLTLIQDKSEPPVKTVSVSARLGVDGLPLLGTEAQRRMKELVVEPHREIQKLCGQLKEIQLAIQKHGVGSGGVGLVASEGRDRDMLSIEDQISSALDDQSPTSLSSWDCVDREESAGVRWVPDHAVSHCQGCGAEFWTGLRRHHCRSCGGVFCLNCSNFFCPVPHEQLFEETTRVCEKCFYKLDGHLRARADPLPVPPT